MATTVNTWVNEASALVAPMLLPCGPTGGAGVTSGTIHRATLDLTTKNGAYIVVCIGRLTVVGLTGNVYINLRRLQLNSVRSVPADYLSFVAGNTTAAASVAVQDTTVASGVNVIPMAATPTTLGTLGNVNILFTGYTVTQASTLTATAALTAEWARAAAMFSATASLGGTAIVLGSPTALVRPAGELVTNQAETFGPYFLEGGAVYELIISAANVTAGGPIAIAAYYESFTTVTTTG